MGAVGRKLNGKSELVMFRSPQCIPLPFTIQIRSHSVIENQISSTKICFVIVSYEYVDISENKLDSMPTVAKKLLKQMRTTSESSNHQLSLFPVSLTLRRKIILFTQI